MARVVWRGATFDERTRDMLVEVDKLVGPDVPIRPTQGSYSNSVGASAGTHSGGGAVDLSVRDVPNADCLKIVRALRTVGFAAWIREPSEGDWPRHIHAIAIGCKDLAPSAAKQVTVYKLRKNGLANNGPDPHINMAIMPRTWEDYLEGKNMADISAQLKAIEAKIDKCIAVLNKIDAGK